MADCTVTIGSLTMGDGTSYWLAPEMIKGLGQPPPKTQDVLLDGQAGGYAGPDYAGPRTLTIPIVILGNDEGAGQPRDTDSCWTRFLILNTAWAASTVDVTLTLRLGGRTATMTGRPRGVVENLSRQKDGLIDAMCTFYCPNPTVTWT